MTRSTGRGRGGNPPAEHRWPKGRSGNPFGRPPKPRDEGFADLMRKQLSKKVRVKIDGQSRTMPMLEAALAKFASDLFNGSPGDRRRALELLFKSGLLDKIAVPAPLDHDALRKFVDQLAQEAQRDEESDREFGGSRGDGPSSD